MNKMTGPGDWELDFGTVKGRTVRDVASTPSGRSYLMWASKQNWCHGYQLKCIRQYLEELKAAPRASPPERTSQ